MRMFIGRLLILCSVAAVVGCGSSVDATKLNADQFTLLSIDGNFYPPSEHNLPAPDVERFHGWPVLGKEEITAQSDRRQLLEAMQQGIDDSDGSVAHCFIPRHAIQIVTGDVTTDYVICFQCLQNKIYETRAGKTTESYVLTTDSPQRVFDAQLRKAGLPRAK